MKKTLSAAQHAVIRRLLAKAKPANAAITWGTVKKEKP